MFKKMLVLYLCLALLAVLQSASASSVDGDRDLIGWLGETYQKVSSSDPDPTERGMIVLSWDPRIFLFKKFLTDEGKTDKVRTSSGMFFAREETESIARIENRIARWTMTHAGQGEGIQLLRYHKTEKYDPHHDYFSHEHSDENGGNRLVTGLMYLSNVEEGGETVFPKVPIPASQTKDSYSECAMKGLAYKPVKGDIVVFWSIRTDGTFDPKSLHGSCPVIKGEKWSATKWIHVGHLAVNGERAVTVKRVMYVPPPPPDVPGCINRQAQCDHWAESGECQDNAGFMVGNAERPGDCIKACNRCDLGPNDKK